MMLPARGPELHNRAREPASSAGTWPCVSHTQFNCQFDNGGPRPLGYTLDPWSHSQGLLPAAHVNSFNEPRRSITVTFHFLFFPFFLFCLFIHMTHTHGDTSATNITETSQESQSHNFSRRASRRTEAPRRYLQVPVSFQRSQRRVRQLDVVERPAGAAPPLPPAREPVPLLLPQRSHRWLGFLLLRWPRRLKPLSPDCLSRAHSPPPPSRRSGRDVTPRAEPT